MSEIKIVVPNEDVKESVELLLWELAESPMMYEQFRYGESFVEAEVEIDEC
jgi:hypothetical protein